MIAVKEAFPGEGHYQQDPLEVDHIPATEKERQLVSSRRL